MCECTPLLPTHSLDFSSSILVARRSLQPRRAILDEIKRYIELDGKLCTSKSSTASQLFPEKGRLLGIEVDTRVGYDTLGINDLAGSTAIEILVEYDITFVFDELGSRNNI